MSASSINTNNNDNNKNSKPAKEQQLILNENLEKAMRTTAPPNDTSKAWHIYQDHLCKGAVPKEGFYQAVINEITGPSPDPANACALLYHLAWKGGFIKGNLTLKRLTRWYDPIRGYSLLHHCVAHHALNPPMWSEAIGALLMLAGARPDVHDNDGFTPLHLAAKLDNWKNGGAAQQLLSLANLDGSYKKRSRQLQAKDKCGRTAFHLAMEEGHILFGKYLVDCGADPARRGYGWACIFMAEYDKAGGTERFAKWCADWEEILKKDHGALPPDMPLSGGSGSDSTRTRGPSAGVVAAVAGLGGVC